MLRHLIYPILPYRSLIAPFLVAAAIAVPCWLLLRLYHLRRSGRPLSFPRELLLVIFVIYLAGLASATLMPNRSSRMLADGRGGIDLTPNLSSLTCSTANLRQGSTARSFCVRNAQGNFVLFLPFGILVPLVWPRMRFWRGLGVALAVSIGIELVQYVSSAWGSYRAADVNDVILNVAGAAVGLMLVTLLRLRREPRAASARS